jgi:signal transduction histidine kinase
MENISHGFIQRSPVLSVETACAYARTREDTGDYAGACALLDHWWKLGQEPCTQGLDWRAQAQLWLRAGTLTGWVGGAEKSGAHNKKAQSWISKSLALFESLGDKGGIAECKIELGYCYYREGALDLAWETYQAALEYLQRSDEVEGCIVALVRRALVEQVSFRFRESKATLESAVCLLQPEHSPFLRGRFFNAYAITLKALGQAENDSAFLQEASTYYEQASHCFECAGSLRSQAAVLNNLGCLLAALGQNSEAEQHFYEARRLFAELQDIACVAQTNEGLVQLFIKAQRYEEAVKIISESVNSFRECREEAWLAQALTAQGIANARLNRWVEARYSFNEALHIAERCADFEGAGRAALSLVEEMCDRLTASERREFFARAEYLLAATQSNEIRERIRVCAEQLATAEEADRRRREQEIQNEKMAALGQLAFGVAHNFNNALTIIKGRAQLLQRMKLPNGSEKGLEMILEVVTDSASMIKRIRDFGRPRTPEDFIRLDVARLLESVVEMARPRCVENQIDLRWTRVAPILVMGEAGELKEVFVNLIYNAIEAVGAAGAIAVSATVKDGKVEMLFADTGVGMSAEVRAHIFEPFFTTKGKKGTGLGLATCYSIVNSHSGIIEVESEPGRGTAFKVIIPLASDKAQEPEDDSSETILPGTHRHVEAALTM